MLQALSDYYLFLRITVLQKSASYATHGRLQLKIILQGLIVLSMLILGINIFNILTVFLRMYNECLTDCSLFLDISLYDEKLMILILGPLISYKPQWHEAYDMGRFNLM